MEELFVPNKKIRLTGMYAHVSVQCIPSPAFVTTKRAFIRFIVGMNFVMTSKISLIQCSINTIEFLDSDRQYS